MSAIEKEEKELRAELSHETGHVSDAAELNVTGQVHHEGAWVDAILSAQAYVLYVSKSVEEDPFKIIKVDAALAYSTDDADGDHPHVLKLTQADAEVVFNCASAEKRAELVKVIEHAIAQQTAAMTDEEAAALKKVRDAFDEKTAAAALGDRDILRVLRFNEGNVEETGVQIRETVLWRERWGVDKLSIAHVRKEFDFGYTHVPGTKDSSGRPIITFEFAKFRPKETTPLNAIKLVIYQLERAIELCGPEQDQVCMICDCTGMRMDNFDEKMERMGFDIVKRYYAGRMGAMIVTNAPPVFRVVWRVMSLWLDRRFAEVSHVFKHKAANIPELLPPDNVPEHLGGGYAYDSAEWLKGRYAAEGVEEGAAAESTMDSDYFQQLQLGETAPKDIEGAVRKGFATKKGSVVKNWKRRYFVLKASCLAYYKTEDSDQAQGIVILERSWTGDGDDDKHFKIHTPLRVYEIKTDTAEDAAAWRKDIQAACDAAL